MGPLGVSWNILQCRLDIMDLPHSIETTSLSVYFLWEATCAVTSHVLLRPNQYSVWVDIKSTAASLSEGTHGTSRPQGSTGGGLIGACWEEGADISCDDSSGVKWSGCVN